MGGRNRRVATEREPHRGDRWDWLKELDQERLTNYGFMARAAQFEGDADHRFQKEALFGEVSREWERRFGERPPFYMDVYERQTRIVEMYKDGPNLSVGSLKVGETYVDRANGTEYTFLGDHRADKKYYVFEHKGNLMTEGTGEMWTATASEVHRLAKKK